MSVTAVTPLPVVILVSGTGSNMLRLVEQAQQGNLPIDVRAVLSDRASAAGLVRARELNIHAEAVPAKEFASRSDYDAHLADCVSSHQPQLVLLAGFMRILSSVFVSRFKDRLLNIHPSLLPNYRGLHTHQRALDAGDQVHGASVHVVTEELDDGPVIMQGRVPILPGDDASSLASRVQRIEHQIYPATVQLFATGRLVCRNNQLWLDDQELRAPLTVNLPTPSAT